MLLEAFHGAGREIAQSIQAHLRIRHVFFTYTYNIPLTLNNLMYDGIDMCCCAVLKTFPRIQ